MNILMKHNTEGCSVRGTRKDIANEMVQEVSMCSYKQIDWKKAEKVLRSNGYQWDKTRKTASAHRHYINANGDRVIINTIFNPI